CRPWLSPTPALGRVAPMRRTPIPDVMGCRGAGGQLVPDLRDLAVRCAAIPAQRNPGGPARATEVVCQTGPVRSNLVQAPLACPEGVPPAGPPTLREPAPVRN